MASLKAKVLYSFEAQGAGELTIREGEIVTITNQNVGEGWWEVRNQRGHTGLVPETYCELSGPPEPKIPLPPTPTAVINTQMQFPKSQSHDAIRQSGMMPGGGNPNGDYMHMGGVPMRKPQQQTTAPPPSSRGGPPPYKAANADDDDFDDDDDWDDDDDDSYTKTSTAQSHVGGRASSSVDVSSGGGGDRDSKYNTVSKKSFRFSQFAKAGAELFIFGPATEESLPSGTVRVTLLDTPNGPRWNSIGQPFVCPISQPHKANKFHGIKSFIAYKITPSFSGIVVTRRYKQFDWLHERLTAKFPMMAIPSLPDKQISGRFEDEFVQERMRWLQLWIDRLCQHPIVAHCDVFQHFLTCTEAKAWKTGKRASEKDNYQAFKFFATVQPLGRIQDAVQVEARMEKYSQFIRSMEGSVRNFLTVGDSNRKKHEGPFMKEFHKLGDAFNALAQSFEFDDRPSARNINVALSYTGRAYQDIGQMFTEQPKKDMNTVLEGLWEYKGIIATLPGVVSMHSAAVSKLQENSSKLTPSETTAALRNVDVVASCVMAEMNHVQEHQVADFKNYMRSYLQGQIDFYKQVTSKLEEALASYNNV